MSKNRWSQSRDFLTVTSLEECLNQKRPSYRDRKKWAWSYRTIFKNQCGGWHIRPDGIWGMETHRTCLTANEQAHYSGQGFTARSSFSNSFVVRLRMTLPIDLNDETLEMFGS